MFGNWQGGGGGGGGGKNLGLVGQSLGLFAYLHAYKNNIHQYIITVNMFLFIGVRQNILK